MTARAAMWAVKLAAGVAFASALSACASDARCPPTAECPVCPSAVVASAAPGAGAGGLGVTSSVPIDLPKAAGPTGVQAMLVVSIAANGDIFVNDQKAAGIDALSALARAHAARDPEARATIQADRSVSHGTVIGVLDALKQAGVTRIAFGVAAPAPSVAPTP